MHNTESDTRQPDDRYMEEFQEDGDFYESDESGGEDAVYPKESPTVLAPSFDTATRFMVTSGNSRRSRQLARYTEESIEINHCRAQVAQVAMANTAALSLQEAHFSKMAPSGKHRFKAIADCYAMRAARQIMELD